MSQEQLDNLTTGIVGITDAIECYAEETRADFRYSGRCANLVEVSAWFMRWLPETDYPGLKDIIDHYFESRQSVPCFGAALNNWAVLCYGRVDIAPGRLGFMVASLRLIANGPPPKPVEPEEPDEDEGEDPEDEKEAGYGV